MMSIIHEPLLQHAAIKELHPTQITVGMRESNKRESNGAGREEKRQQRIWTNILSR